MIVVGYLEVVRSIRVNTIGQLPGNLNIRWGVDEY